MGDVLIREKRTEMSVLRLKTANKNHRPLRAVFEVHISTQSSRFGVFKAVM
jgi:hypothetical protein